MSFYSEFAEYYETVFPYEESVYAFLRSRVPKDATRVLDIGCGTGDYCGRFSEQGLQAVGIDLDPWMIARARKRYPVPEFRELGMQDVPKLEGSFGAAWCIGNVAAHLEQLRLPAFLSAVRNLLSPGSLWVVQTVNWDAILGRETYAFPDVEVGRDGLVFARRYPEISENRVVFETSLTKDGNVVFEGQTELYPVRSSEYVRLHQQAGFRSTGHYGGFDEEVYAPESSLFSVLVFSRD